MFKDWFSSKKFKTALLAAGVAFVANYLGFSQEQVWSTISPFLVYIGLQGVVDTKLALKKK